MTISQTSSTSANLELMRTTFEAFNAGDLDTCLARIAPDFVINLAGTPQLRGRDVWREGLEIMRRGFPDIRAEIVDMLGVDDQVAMRLTFRGTHTGEFQGIPATGRDVEYTSHEFYRITDGIIAEEWICSDLATLFQQIS